MQLMKLLRSHYRRIMDWVLYTTEFHDTPSLRDIVQNSLEGCTGSDYTNQVLRHYDNLSEGALAELMTRPHIEDEVSDNRYDNIIRTILTGIPHEVLSVAGTTITRKVKRFDHRDAKTRSAELEQLLFDQLDDAWSDEQIDRIGNTMRSENSTDYTEIDECLLAGICGTNARAWAEAFQQIVVEQGITIDEDLMLGWFANAMEQARYAR